MASSERKLHRSTNRPRVFASDISWILQHVQPLDDTESDTQPIREDLNRVIRTVVDDDRVAKAFEDVDRLLFVPEAYQDLAYSNAGSIPPTEISPVISKPSMVAKMTALLELKGDEKVLEVGAGSGYGAAILSRLAREVHSVEIRPDLAESASTRLKGLGFDNIVVHQGNGSLGLSEQAPFDAIILTAAVFGEVPIALREQMAPGGRMVLPIKPSFVIPSGPDDQMLLLLKKGIDGSLHGENKGIVRFQALES
jgi:protein-L-isoaspartate(D-aspartate) O-methyltransferase